MLNTTLLSSIPAQLTPLSLLRMCWKHKTGIVVIWIVITVLGFAIVSRLPAVYTSEALILVEAQKIPPAYVTSTVTTDVQDRLATINQQILSVDRLQKIIDDFNLYASERKNHVQEEILQMMRKDITVRQDKGWTNNKPGAFRVGYTGGNPAVVAQVANRIANLYIEENMRSRETQAQGTTEFVEAQLQETRKQLNGLESAMTAYKQRHNGELPEQATVIGSTLARLQMEQNNNREAIARAEASKAMIENTLSLAESTVEALSQQPTTAVVVTANGPVPVLRVPPPPKKESEVLQAQLEELRSRYAEGHPEIKRLKLEIATAKMIEAKNSQEVAAVPKPPAPTAGPAAKDANAAAQPPEAGEGPAVGQARERVKVLKSQIELTDKEISGRKAEQERIAAGIADAQARLTNIPVREQELAQIMRDYGSVSGTYQGLLKQETSAKMSTDMEMRQKSERFTIADPARPGGKPVGQSHTAYGALASLGGLLLGLCFAVGQEYRKDLVLGPWELPASAILLARVPRISLSKTDHGRTRRFWWGKPKRVAVASSVLLPLIGILVAVKLYFWS
jgi:polysaccharide chain length determinant protein (PEP-CTERM system associated)